jgi:hypothetical protein
MADSAPPKSRTYGHPDFPGVDITLIGDEDDNVRAIISGSTQEQLEYVYAYLTSLGIPADAIDVGP